MLIRVIVLKVFRNIYFWKFNTGNLVISILYWVGIQTMCPYLRRAWLNLTAKKRAIFLRLTKILAFWKESGIFCSLLTREHGSSKMMISANPKVQRKNHSNKTSSRQTKQNQWRCPAAFADQPEACMNRARARSFDMGLCLLIMSRVPRKAGIRSLMFFFFFLIKKISPPSV